MRKTLVINFAFLLAAISLLNSCTKTSPLGAELLDGDQASIRFTDTLSLRMATISEDSVLVYSPNNAFNSMLVGEYDDAIFGNTKSSIFAQVKSAIAITNDFTDTTIDSIVLSLAYEPVGFYGITDEPKSISVHRVLQDMDRSATYYSNEHFDYDPIPLATKTFTPNLDSAMVGSYLVDTIVTTTPQLRIPLDNMLGEEILAELQEIYPDTSIGSLAKDSLFLEYFKGIHIREEGPGNGMVGFDLSTGNSALTIYYRQTVDGEEDKNIISFSFNTTLANISLVRMAHIEHSFPATVSGTFNDFAAGNNEVFLQGLSGPNIQIEIPSADQLDNSIINKAELEFTISVEDTMDFASPLVIAVSTRNQNGAYFPIDDLIFAQNTNLANFGGIVEAAEGARQVYKMNIAGIFQDMADGLEESTLYLRVLSKQEQARRVTLLGPGQSEHPAKLSVTYTRLNE